MKPSKPCPEMDFGSPAFEALIEQQVLLLKALANKNRLKIIYLLRRGDSVPLAVIREQLDISKAHLSQQVSELRKAGIVSTSHQGRNVLVRLVDPSLVDACGIVRDSIRKHLQKQMETLLPQSGEGV